MENNPKRSRFWTEDKNNIVEKVCDKIFRAVSLVSIAATVVIMVITVIDVLERTILNQSLKGVMEITQFLMVFVCYFAMPWVTWQFGHIKVDLLTTKLPAKAQGVILVVDKFICLAFTGLMTYEIWKQGIQSKVMHAVGAVTKIPVYPFYYITAVMMGVVIIAMLVNLISLAALGKEKER